MTDGNIRSPIDTAAMIAEQRGLAARVCPHDDLLKPIQTVAGVDAAFPQGGRITRAAAVLMSYPELELIDQAAAELPTRLPYIPGLLSFRELPAIEQALARLAHSPDLVLCDGQGIAHPRRFGIACHLGVATGLATVGVGKSRLCGQFDEPGRERGASSLLRDGEEIIGEVVRTRRNVRPLFVSIGHRVDLAYAVQIVLRCAPRYRLPEPVRQADRLAGQSR